jgi:hypothetical protein
LKRHDSQESSLLGGKSYNKGGLACIPRRGIGTQSKEHLQHLLQSVQQLQKRSYNCVCWPYNKEEAQKSRLLVYNRLARFSMQFAEFSVLYRTVSLGT